MKAPSVVAYSIRFVPLFALIWMILWAPWRTDPLGVQASSAWLSESRNARTFGKLLVDDYPEAIGPAVRKEILEVLRDFDVADRTLWGELESRGPAMREEVQARRARADKLYEEATKRLARALPRAPGLVKLGAEESAGVSRLMQARFGSVLLLVYRPADSQAAPGFVSREVDLRWGKRIHVDLPDRKPLFFAAELTHAPERTSRFTVEFVSGYKLAAKVDLTVEAPVRKAVEIEVQDQGGAATEAAVGLYSAGGHFIVPDSALDFTGGGYDYAPEKYRELTTTRYWPGEDGFRRCFFVKGRFQVELPPGDYRLLASKGPEYLPIDRTFRVAEEAPRRQVLALERWSDMSARGWHSGDCHIHYARPNREANERLEFWARAEDLRVGNILRMGDGRRTYFEQYAFGKQGRVRHEGGVVVPGQEDPRTNIIGYTISLNIQSPARDMSRYYLYSVAFDEARSKGGLSGYAHVNMNLYRVDRDMTLNVPRGKVDFVEICEFGQIRSTDLYYEFLNLGFRLPAVAGTDVPWAGTLGDSRVYAFTGEELDADGWFDAVKQGRTFVTVGPMLEFTVDGHRPGQVLQPARGKELDIYAKASVGAPNVVSLSRLELVVNGEVIRSVEPRGGSAEFHFKLPANESMWVAARTAETHASPIYVVVDGKRHWNIAQAPTLLKKRLETLDEVERLFDRGEIDPGHDAEWDAPEVFRRNRDAMREMIAEARVIYRELQQELEGGGEWWCPRGIGLAI